MYLLKYFKIYRVLLLHIKVILCYSESEVDLPILWPNKRYFFYFISDSFCVIPSANRLR